MTQRWIVPPVTGAQPELSAEQDELLEKSRQETIAGKKLRPGKRRKYSDDFAGDINGLIWNVAPDASGSVDLFDWGIDGGSW